MTKPLHVLIVLPWQEHRRHGELDDARDVEDVRVEDGHGTNLGAPRRGRQAAPPRRALSHAKTRGSRLRPMMPKMMSVRLARTHGRLPKK